MHAACAAVLIGAMAPISNTEPSENSFPMVEAKDDRDEGGNMSLNVVNKAHNARMPERRG